MEMGTPSASVVERPGPKGRVRVRNTKRVTPRHMTMGQPSLPFSSGIKVTTPARLEPRATVQFSVVGATSRKSDFATVHVRFAPPIVHKSLFFEQPSTEDHTHPSSRCGFSPAVEEGTEQSAIFAKRTSSRGRTRRCLNPSIDIAARARKR